MQIVVTETDGLRLMRFGTRWCQGAMRIDAPDRLELEYALRMSAWLLFHRLDELGGKHLATLGLGAASLTKFAYRVLGMRTTAVEIDAAVIDACHAHFLLPPDSERLHVLHADAAEFVATPGNAGSIDVLQVDAYDAAVKRPALDNDAFYAHCRVCLREGGTLCVNLIGAGLDVRASVARIRQQMRPQAVWQFPPTQAGNVVVIAHCAAAPDEAVLAARADEIEKRWDLPARQWLAMPRRSG
jgi:spermidine synthase